MQRETIPVRHEQEVAGRQILGVAESFDPDQPVDHQQRVRLARQILPLTGRPLEHIASDEPPLQSGQNLIEPTPARIDQRHRVLPSCRTLA
ncbi:hypothetical protein [Nocardia cyriacigeorgica]|uniref:hypothetical protein n=1 Tax=Nocardia cyriacigeorgica TaxID=135487 RepID=UPI002113D052|nr:hypothetical protein [Nocardia cyriacigeorgica]